MYQNKKMVKCREFFNELSKLLRETHEVVGSCNKDTSVYLIPKGSLPELSYYGKPENSFRLSDHWNWYSSFRKCSKEDYIQCHSVDCPEAISREQPGKPTIPVQAIQVAYYGTDGLYHAIYGDHYDRETDEWSWLENSPANAMRMIQ